MVSFGPGKAIQGPKRTRIPDFDRPVSAGGHDFCSIVVIGDGFDRAAVSARLLSLEIQCTCQGSQKWSDLAKERRFWVKFAPASQTLIVPEPPPDTILVPSGENCTDLML